MKLLASLLSRIFDPLVLIVWFVIYATSTVAKSGKVIDWELGGILMGILVGIPALAYGVMLKTGRIEDIDVSRRESRIPLFHLTIGCQVAGIMLTWWMGAWQWLSMLLVVLVMSVIILVLTWFWKVSIHMVVVTSVMMLLIEQFGWGWGWLVIVPMVGWSRVYLKQHSPVQVLVGGLIPLVVLGMLWPLT